MNFRHTARVLGYLTSALVVLAARPAAAEAPAPVASLTDGASPLDSLLAVGDRLYGTTYLQGAAGCGTVFSIATDGTDFQVLHSFGEAANDGAFPCGSLLRVGDTLYGMTSGGGDGGLGTVFSMKTDGADYAVLHHFLGEENPDGDGAFPCGSLLAWGGRLYGLTSGGGPMGLGVLFSVWPDGADFAVHHFFSEDDGFSPIGSLVLAGDRFVGTTTMGGLYGNGTLFSIGTDLTGCRVDHHFEGGSGDGASPCDSLLAVGDRLYGTTCWGGEWDAGTVFSIRPDGTDYALVHSFSGNDGWGPHGNLVLWNGRLYGTTLGGGEVEQGTLFSLLPDGTDFALLHSFSGEDGSCPMGSLTPLGERLYGLASSGGTGWAGTLFSINADGTDVQVHHHFSWGEEGGIAPDGGTLPDGSGDLEGFGPAPSLLRAGAESVIVDNRDANTRRVGRWRVSNRRTRWATDSLYSKSRTSKFYWFPVLPRTGYYELYAWWAAAGTRARRAPYTIAHADGRARVRVNQRRNGGRWNLLGTFRFEAGGSGTVWVWGVNGQACADAVKFVYVGPAAPAP